jgi:hypothetical protein
MTNAAPAVTKTAVATNASVLRRMTPNGEVEVPPETPDQAPRAHKFSQRQRHVPTSRSRTPPTIV